MTPRKTQKSQKRSAQQLRTQRTLSCKFLPVAGSPESLTTITEFDHQQLFSVLRQYEAEAGDVIQFGPLLYSEISRHRSGSQVELRLHIRAVAFLPILRHRRSPKSNRQ